MVGTTSFSDFYVTHRTRKSHFLNQIDALIDWSAIESVIQSQYAPGSDVTGRPAYPGLLLFKMLLVGIWHGGLSDEAVEDMANANLHVMRFLELALEDDVPDHSVLSRFRSRLTHAGAWDGLLVAVNQQIQAYQVTLTAGVHIDASLTPSPRKPKTKPTYEIVADREERDDETEASANMRVVQVIQPGVDREARWTKKGGKTEFGFKQHTLVDDNGLVLAIETTPANRHDSVAMLDVIDKADVQPCARLHGDKAYGNRKHRQALKQRRIKNALQDKAAKNKALTPRQQKRNRLCRQGRYVVERTFGSQARWFNGKTFRYVGLAKAHAWHSLLAMAYNLKRLPALFIQKNLQPEPYCA